MSEITAKQAKAIIESNWPPESYTMLREALNLALTALDQLRWRDAEKEPPKYTGDYNVVCNVGSMLGGYTTVRTYRFERIPGREPKWYIPNRPDEVVTITHWLPLPTSPEVRE